MNKRIVLQNNVADDANGANVDCAGYALATVWIEPTGFTGSVVFEGFLETAGNDPASDDWLAVAGLDAADLATKANTLSLTTSSDLRLFHVPVRGLTNFRVRVARSAGNVTVRASFSPASF
jgi:hypothetical protein